MKYELYNEDTLIFTFEMDTEMNTIESIYSISHIEAAPISIYQAYIHNSDYVGIMNHWFHRRYLPDYRINFYSLIEDLELFDLYEFREDYHTMSIADQYWIKPADSLLTYSDLYYHQDYPSFYEYVFYHHIIPLTSRHDPNITTDGMLEKGWKYIDHEYYLYKKSMFETNIEPYIERLAYLIGKALDMNIIEYWIEEINGIVASVCKTFIHPGIEYVPCDEINSELEVIDHEHYIQNLESKGLKDARRRVEEMIILDFLILNIDRHPYNFGVIRDTHTLEYLSVAPLFDHGNGLFAFHEDETMNRSKDLLQKEHEPIELLSVLRDPRMYDLSKVEIACNQFREEMKEWPVESATVERMIAIVLKQKDILWNYHKQDY